MLFTVYTVLEEKQKIYIYIYKKKHYKKCVKHKIDTLENNTF